MLIGKLNASISAMAKPGFQATSHKNSSGSEPPQKACRAGLRMAASAPRLGNNRAYLFSIAGVVCERDPGKNLAIGCNIRILSP